MKKPNISKPKKRVKRKPRQRKSVDTNWRGWERPDNFSEPDRDGDY